VTPKEGAFLAMLLPSPQRYSVSYRRKQLTGFANQTVERILAKMVQAGFINKEAAQHESCSPLNFEAMLESGASVSWRQERCFDLDNPLYLNH
jgi:monofunctional biosynthetic peptidoglycan transglycosylase